MAHSGEPCFENTRIRPKHGFGWFGVRFFFREKNGLQIVFLLLKNNSMYDIVMKRWTYLTIIVFDRQSYKNKFCMKKVLLTESKMVFFQIKHPNCREKIRVLRHLDDHIYIIFTYIYIYIYIHSTTLCALLLAS